MSINEPHLTLIDVFLLGIFYAVFILIFLNILSAENGKNKNK